MSFCTAINCSDSQVPESVNDFLKDRFAAQAVDQVTVAAPARALAERDDRHLVAAVLDGVAASLKKHQSRGLAVVGHEDCGANPSPKDEQLRQMAEALAFLRKHYPDTPTIALWADRAGGVEELTELPA